MGGGSDGRGMAPPSGGECENIAAGDHRGGGRMLPEVSCLSRTDQSDIDRSPVRVSAESIEIA